MATTSEWTNTNCIASKSIQKDSCFGQTDCYFTAIIVGTGAGTHQSSGMVASGSGTYSGPSSSQPSGFTALGSGILAGAFSSQSSGFTALGSGILRDKEVHKRLGNGKCNHKHSEPATASKSHDSTNHAATSHHFVSIQNMSDVLWARKLNKTTTPKSTYFCLFSCGL